MLTGWAKPFKINRLITQTESVAKLPRQRQMRGSPKLQHSLIRFNSTYADFIGRDYRFRGMSGTLVALLIAVPLILFLAFLVVGVFPDSYLSGEEGFATFIISEVAFVVILISVCWMLWRLVLRYEFLPTLIIQFVSIEKPAWCMCFVTRASGGC